ATRSPTWSTAFSTLPHWWVTRRAWQASQALLTRCPGVQPSSCSLSPRAPGRSWRAPLKGDSVLEGSAVGRDIGIPPHGAYLAAAISHDDWDSRLTRHDLV